ncbi:MAG: hypothetical protein FJ010_12070 [Chloroflexi bacterium]|nr:hypothetical protein [Chloroflexota bacterium]
MIPNFIIMPSLADKLKSMGVDMGINELKPKKPLRRDDYPIEGVLAGEWRSTPCGETFVVETRYADTFRRGTAPLRGDASLEIIAAWAKEPELAMLHLEQFVFLDTETTGLAGGAGTYTFLIGAGRFEGDGFRLAQFFLRDPAEETAQLAAFEKFVAPCEAIVSFNGKAFDMPLLDNRYILNGWPPPLKNAGHLDLLHLARRLWKARLPSRALGDLEARILGATRSQQDVPGWMVAELYFDYLHTGDARPLRGVFYHNEMDVISLAALLNHMSMLLADPMSGGVEYGLDLIAIGKLYADLGYFDQAARIYQHGLTHDDVQHKAYWKAIEQLSFLHKKSSDIEEAMKLWQQAAEDGQIYAYVELAKMFEHKKGDFAEASRWTQQAIEIVSAPEYPDIERAQWLPELEHRLVRLEKRQNASSDITLQAKSLFFVQEC